ncbi:hypothetical protein [Pseudomonas sp.]|nr:hypothetical protein [Pseudomonas sp.]MDP2244082.1 hypothetical protein [Pseudomonas sp.]
MAQTEVERTRFWASRELHGVELQRPQHRLGCFTDRVVWVRG